ncbi:Gfo/Idh/MocA family oxidoreductase [Lentzea sp. NPDC058450]|uniref:Gfo/Idh/MocA family oxidoreductase n=1 Tax=Lentzea sp. NPDC058450 TaxID=3346505 RepID=UPI003666F12A
MRIGIIGTENSHVDHIIEHLAAGPSRVVAISGGDTPRNRALQAKGSLDVMDGHDDPLRLVNAPEDLLGLVDAVVVADRLGDLHRAHAVPFLREGLPVFVDKPLACTVEDASAIIAEAAAHHAPLTSFSALRWLPAVEALASAGPFRRVTASGPVDPASPYGGIFFYGIHPVDVALRLAPGPVHSHEVTRLPDRIVVTAEVGSTEVEISLMLGDAPFTVSADSARQVLELDEHYFVPGLEAFLTMAATGTAPIGHDDLLRPIQLLTATAKAIA